MTVRDSIGRLPGIWAAFLRLGCIAFGGPAAHLALLEDEFVSRRGWLSRQRFLDLMGATNLIPGPNSTEMTMHIGYERGGALGLFSGGLGFVLPAAAITAVLASIYVKIGTLPSAEAFLQGVRPAVLVVILGAVLKLGRKAAANAGLAVIATGVALAVLAGIGEIPALLVGGIIGGLALLLPRALGAGMVVSLFMPGSAMAAEGQDASLGALAQFFFKVGCVLYGSGYVLIAFLEGGLVQDYGWVTQQQLLDAIAVGQFTPGPVLTAATFLGYVIGGWSGALVATAGIFLPGFGFVWMLNPLVRRLRTSRVSAAFLDAVNAAAVGLIAAVAIDLARVSLVSVPAWIFASCAAAALFLARLPAAWIIAGAGTVGLLSALAGLT
ncbi:MAG: chromate efflux transporter [Bryobacterales bacterium]|nr:chromate efflux transporter [Bryobacterales bacterium]